MVLLIDHDTEDKNIFEKKVKISIISICELQMNGVE
jgi:hypothetical protein